MRVNSHNEWDTLREIIVGRPEARAAMHFPDGLPSDPKKLQQIEALARSAFPDWLVEEIREDLEGLSTTLTKAGVKVLRPDSSRAHRIFTTPFYSGAGDHIYNMRDLNLVVGNTVVESPSQEWHRYFEAQGLYDIWYEYLKDDFRWICGPKPRLNGDHMQIYYEGGKDQYDDGQKFVRLTETEILFEAANTVRMGRDLLYLVSRSGNNLGAKWLQSVLGDEYRVHTTDKIYKSSHIDSTVLCLRPGLVMLNANRVSENSCPAILDSWEKIYFDDMIPIPERTLTFHEEVRKPVNEQLRALGVEAHIDSVASKYIGLNFLSLDPHTIIVDERQEALMRQLDRLKITPVPISFRHSYYMGGIHCSTLDTVRDSKYESYFG